MVANTGSRSPGELLITWSTSDVAACCSSASVRSAVRSVRSVVRWRSSLSRRVFSMAMTAWAGKLDTSSICSSENGRTSYRASVNVPSSSSSFSIGTIISVRVLPNSTDGTGYRFAFGVSVRRRNIDHVNNRLCFHHATNGIVRARTKIRRTLERLCEGCWCVVRSDVTQTIAFGTIDVAELSITGLDRALLA
jgi:hypothetical protein